MAGAGSLYFLNKDFPTVYFAVIIRLMPYVLKLNFAEVLIH